MVKSKKGAIIILIFLIMITVVYSLYVYYYKHYMVDEPNIVSTELSSFQKEELNSYLNSISTSFRGMFVNRDSDDKLFINYDNNLLDTESKQRFVFNYLKDKDVSDINFATSGNNTYLDYDTFDKYYRILFGTTLSDRVRSNDKTEYDDDAYVYYNVGRFDEYGIDSFEVKSGVFDSRSNLYSALVSIKYNENVIKKFAVDMDDAIILYGVNEEDIYLVMFKIRKS